MMEGWNDGRMDGLMEGWGDGMMEGWNDGRMDGLMEGWRDGMMEQNRKIFRKNFRKFKKQNFLNVHLKKILKTKNSNEKKLKTLKTELQNKTFECSIEKKKS